MIHRIGTFSMTIITLNFCCGKVLNYHEQQLRTISNLEGHPKLSIMLKVEAHLFLLLRRNELPLRTFVTPRANPLSLVAPRVSDADKRNLARNSRCFNFTELDAGDGVCMTTNQTIVTAGFHLIGVRLQGKWKNIPMKNMDI